MHTESRILDLHGLLQLYHINVSNRRLSMQKLIAWVLLDEATVTKYTLL